MSEEKKNFQVTGSWTWFNKIRASISKVIKQKKEEITIFKFPDTKASNTAE